MQQKDYMYADGDLYLYPFRESDINDETYRSWFTNPEVTKYNSHGLFPMTEDRMKSFVHGLNKDHIVFKIMIKTLDIEKHHSSDHAFGSFPEKFVWIGNCSLQSFNWINRSSEFAIVIGDVTAWGKGYATRCLKLLFEHGFNKLGLNRIWTGTAATNKGMQAVAEAAGMKLEGLSRQGTYLDGEFVDVCHYGILREEWNAIKRSN
jgi:RimJ/RimL family protein N-acetyltransferase